MSDNESVTSHVSDTSVETIDLEQSELYQAASVFLSSSKGDLNLCDTLLKMNKTLLSIDKSLKKLVANKQK